MRWVPLAMVLVALAASPLLALDYVRVADITPGFASGGAGDLTVYNGELYFIANNVAHGSNNELWKWTGSAVVQAAEIRPGVEGSGINSLTVHAGKLFFGARDDASTLELWAYNAATGLAQEIPDNNPAWNPQNPSNLCSFDGDLYYQAVDFSTVGMELGRYDGSVQRVVDLWPGTGHSLPQFMTVYNNQLYFSAGTVANDGGELTRLNPDKASATRVANINQVSGGSSPGPMTVFNGSLYFAAYDGVHGTELWRHTYGVSPDAELVADIRVGGPYDSGGPYGMTGYNGLLYFSADDGGPAGSELWRYDPATDTASLFWNINLTPPPSGGEDPMHSSYPTGFCVWDGLLYFSADDGVHGRELWATDGSTAWMVLDILPGAESSAVGGLTIFNGDLYFVANDGQTGSELGYIEGEYTVSQAIFRLPEPATLALLALGGLAVLRRR